MNHRLRSRSYAPGRQAGVGLVTAIFILVVLAGLAVAIVSMSSAQQAASSLDVLGARAYQGARAGVEWALFQQRINNSCLPGPTTFALPANTSLSSFTVSVTCNANPFPGQSANFRVTATACNGIAGAACPGPGTSHDYVERMIEVQF